MKKTVVLTFDDCCKSHIKSAVPILQKYGFNATFFFCRFNDEWRSRHEDTLMTQADAKQLCDAGFEIGNHTWNHLDLRKLSEKEITLEFDLMESWLQEAGCPPSLSFAYPGGPYAENAVEVLRKRNIKLARTTEQTVWTQNTPPLRVPSYAICKDDEQLFYQALRQAENDRIPVLLYHGIPEIVHPHCTNSLAFFEKNMKYLHDNDYSAVSMRDILDYYEQ